MSQNIVRHVSCDEIIATVRNRWDGIIEIDEASIVDTIYTQIKNFKNLATVQSYSIVRINNHQGNVPEDLVSIIRANLAEPYKIYSNNISNNKIIKTRTYSLEQSGFNVIENTCCEKSELACQDTCDCSTKYFCDVEVVEETPVIFTYNKGECIDIVPHVKGQDDRKGMFLSYYDDTLHTSFKKGSVALKYNCLPIDEDTEYPMIPELRSDYMRQFLIKAIDVDILDTPKYSKNNDFIKIRNANVNIINEYNSLKDKVELGLSKLSKRDYFNAVRKRRAKHNRYFNRLNLN